MAVGQAGRLLQLVNRLRRVAPSAARVTSSATRGASGAAKVTGGATKAAQTANTVNKGGRGGLLTPGRVGGFVKGTAQLVAPEIPGLVALGAFGTAGYGLTQAARGALDGSYGDSPDLTSTNPMSARSRLEAGDIEFDAKTGQVKGQNVFDHLTNLVTGTSQEDIKGAGTKIRQEGFYNANQTNIDKLLAASKNSGFIIDPGLRITPGKDGETAYIDNNQNIKTQQELLAEEVRRLNNFEAFKADGAPVTGNMSNVQLNQTKTEFDRAKPTSQESIIARQIQRQTQLDAERLAQQTYQNKLADYQFTLSQARMDHQEKTAAADRQQTLQFKLMDRQDARADRAERSELRDRQDRRAAIASMTKGLAQLGYAFAM